VTTDSGGHTGNGESNGRVLHVENLEGRKLKNEWLVRDKIG